MTVFLWALLTAGIWGIVPFIEKLGLGKSDPMIGVFARSLGVVFGVVCVTLWRWPWPALSALGGRSILLLALGGLLASVVGQFAFYHALRAGAVSHVTPVAGAYPLVAALLGWICLREPFTLARMAGVLCVVAGVFLLRK